MQGRQVLAAALLAVLTACGQGDYAEHSAPEAQPANGAPQNKFGFQESLEKPRLLPDPQADAKEAAQDAAATAADGASQAAQQSARPDVTATTPKIAYAYTFGFRVTAANMVTLQRRHAAACEQLGPQRCRVMQLSNSGDEGDYGYGDLVLEVAASDAKQFGEVLAKAAEGTGAAQVSNAISGEDLTKQIIDTDARLQARIVLRDRLLKLLASHNGTVAELIEAERGVADVNEEIDEARRTLKELNGRVDFSRVEINYVSSDRAGPGFLAPIKAVLGSLGMILGGVIAALIAIAVALVPISAFVFGMRWLWRRVRRQYQRLVASQKHPET